MYADAYLPDGTPVYFKYARASGKSQLQLDMYMAALEKRERERTKLLYEDLIATHERFMEASMRVSFEPLCFHVAGTGMSDERAIDAWKDTEIIVITRDGHKWQRGEKIE